MTFIAASLNLLRRFLRLCLPLPECGLYTTAQGGVYILGLFRCMVRDCALLLCNMFTGTMEALPSSGRSVLRGRNQPQPSLLVFITKSFYFIVLDTSCKTGNSLAFLGPIIRKVQVKWTQVVRDVTVAGFIGCSVDCR